MGKRETVARLLDRTGAVDLILRVRRAVRLPRAERYLSWLSAITYHRVAAVDPASPYDDDVIDATPAQFDAHLETIAKHFSVIGVDELVRFYAGEPLPPNPLIITFDDGYKDCVTHALPALQRHGLRAMFFVATDYVAGRKVYWWDRLAYLLSKSTRERVELSYPEPRTLDLSAGTAGALEELYGLVKGRQGLDLPRLLDEVASATGVAWTAQLERAVADELVMTWDEVRALRAAGMDVESHTRSHRVLQTLPRDALAHELAGSRVSRDVDPLDIARVGMGRGFSQHYFRSVLAVPQLAYNNAAHR